MARSCSAVGVKVVRPDGLPVRTARTESPKPADSRLLLIPKVVSSITLGYFPISVPYSSIRMPYFSISVPYSRQKKSFFCVLPSLPPFFARNPFIYWGSRTGGKTNIPPVSLPSRVPCFQNGRERTKKREGNGRDNHSPSRASNALYIGI